MAVSDLVALPVPACGHQHALLRCCQPLVSEMQALLLVWRRHCAPVPGPLRVPVQVLFQQQLLLHLPLHLLQPLPPKAYEEELQCIQQYTRLCS